MKKLKATLLIDEDLLLKAYCEGHDIKPKDCPPVEDMVRSEIMWVLQSGIDLIGDIVEVES
ncbi:hypothetical protein C7B62_24425 [Pleurocapsa sp. CCALA 161]|uniref:hypothetical protein n=1 Tax=Pleurocapsa sp. CCALA 161 TaxID=2107688 RepID=UPI000D04A973|nr:hypothetical protein [Pleurocapsa sp. CCALA 161]PSB05794.1 hypothetical protein C7B62_24425 [Pleurocapsa sp. CCALA 161]